MKIIKKLCIVLTMLLSLVCLVKPANSKASNDYSYPTQEFRAAWVSHFAGDISSYQNETQYKQMMTTVLDNMQSWGMNAIIYHIRTHNNAMYDSDLNPIAKWWSNVNFEEFDPLTWLIDETHKRGMEFHAWMNPYRVSSSGVSSLDELAASFPANNIASNKANYLATSGGVILDPGLPEVRNFIVDTCMEVVEKYDVDAIHFDDYFYISGVDDTATRNKYNTKNLSTADFRREQVNLFMEQLHNEITAYNEANNTFVQLGISPSGIYQNGSYGSGTTPQYDANGSLTYPLYSNTSGFAHYGDYLYSDTKKWIDEGWIDYILPQAYWAISHSSASFSKLTEWWSWCVRNKDCNLYLGQGIYMALEYSSTATGSYKYWGDPDEIKNQILNMDSHPETDGASMYKYATLLSNNSLIKSAVSHLKTYWNKQIPGAVIKSFKDTPAIEVENVMLNNTTLSWDAVENVRQYVVWRVNKGASVDTNNIEHLYKCTTATELEVEAGYDYYVSTVNKANVISTPTTMKKEVTYQEVIELISALPIDVTLEDEALVNSILSYYNELSNEAKLLVSNYIILENAIQKINSLKIFEVKVNNALNSINKDAGKVTLLPLYYDGLTISWEYKNPNDSEYFDISTGQKKKLILKTQYVDLLATFTQNGQTIVKEFNLNIGVTKSNEHGLFYRNDSGAMSKNDNPSFTGGYIGASGRSLSFNGYRYFIATGNDFDITSSSISGINWSSCGGFYKNVGSSTITLIVGSETVPVYNASNYGYFIIGNDNKVRYTTSEYVEGEKIVLAPGEAFYAIRYLDGQITGSPMKPATNIKVGTTVLLEDYESDFEVLNSDIVNALISEINKLDVTITLEHEAMINRALAIYNGLDANTQSQVNNYANLQSAKLALDNLSALQNQYKVEKEEAINEIQNAISDLTIYSNANQSVIKLIINNAIIEINQATTIEKINEVKQNALTQLDEILTIEEEDAATLPLVKSEAINSLTSYVELSLYSSSNQEVINNLINEAKNLINASSTKAQVDGYVKDAKTKIDEVLTLAQELSTHKTNTISQVESYVVLSDYSSENQDKVKTYINSAKASIIAATTIEEVNNAFDLFKSSVDGLPTKAEQEKELNDAKAAAIKKLEDAIDLNLYTEDNKKIVLNKLSIYIDKINFCANTIAINNVLSSGLSEIAAVEKDAAAFEEKKLAVIKELESYLNPTLYSEENYQRVEELVNTYSEIIRNINSVSILNSELTEAKEMLANIKTLEEELIAAKLSAKNELSEFVNTFEVEAEKKEELNAKLQEILANIDTLTSILEVNEMISSSKQELEKIATTDKLAEYKEEMIEELETYINRNTLTASGQNLFDEEIEVVTKNINEATTKEEIDELVANSKLALDDIHNNYQVTTTGTSCFGIKITYIMMFISLIAIALVASKKR